MLCKEPCRIFPKTYQGFKRKPVARLPMLRRTDGRLLQKPHAVLRNSRRFLRQNAGFAVNPVRFLGNCNGVLRPHAGFAPNIPMSSPRLSRFLRPHSGFAANPVRFLENCRGV